MKLLKVTKTEYNEAGQLVVTAVGAKSTFSAEDCAPHGTDSRAVPGELVLYNDTEKIGDEFMVGYLVTERIAETGEHRTFCTDADGNFKFNVWLRADGTTLIGDSNTPSDYVNFAVKYNEAKIELDKTNLYLTTLRTATQTALVAIDAVVPGTSAAFIAAMGTLIPGDYTDMKNEIVKFN